jgi:hypothetical protein
MIVVIDCFLYSPSLAEDLPMDYNLSSILAGVIAGIMRP